MRQPESIEGVVVHISSSGDLEVRLTLKTETEDVPCAGFGVIANSLIDQISSGDKVVLTGMEYEGLFKIRAFYLSSSPSVSASPLTNRPPKTEEERQWERDYYDHLGAQGIIACAEWQEYGPGYNRKKRKIVVYYSDKDSNADSDFCYWKGRPKLALKWITKHLGDDQMTLRYRNFVRNLLGKESLDTEEGRTEGAMIDFYSAFSAGRLTRRKYMQFRKELEIATGMKLVEKEAMAMGIDLDADDIKLRAMTYLEKPEVGIKEGYQQRGEARAR